MRRTAAIALGIVALFLPAALGAQTAPPACAAAEHRQFDFWVGRWTVTDSAGQTVGENEITRIAGGCGVQESWRGTNGTVGTSLNAYDAVARRWMQVWVGSRGVILHLSGGLEGGSMVMTGERDSPRGHLHDRVAWTPLPDGTVRQRWETSADGGRTWTVAFLGTYRRAE